MIDDERHTGRVAQGDGQDGARTSGEKGTISDSVNAFRGLGRDLAGVRAEIREAPTRAVSRAPRTVVLRPTGGRTRKLVRMTAWPLAVVMISTVVAALLVLVGR